MTDVSSFQIGDDVLLVTALCEVEWCSDRQRWRAWDEDGREIFASDKHMACLRLFGKRRMEDLGQPKPIRQQWVLGELAAFFAVMILGALVIALAAYGVAQLA